MVLRDLVTELGHQSILVENGMEAVEVLQLALPDLVLLDIVMPEMDGFEVLNWIKQSITTAHLPVIVISAVDAQENIVRAIQSGADDYLTKPFDRAILQARIEAALSRKQLADFEHDYQQVLQQEVERKTAELQRLNAKLAHLDQAKSDFLRLISHELRTPLNGLIGPLEILLNGEASEETRVGLTEVVRDATDRLDQVVEQASMLSRLQIGDHSTLEREPVGLRPILQEIAEAARETLAQRKLILEPLPDCAYSVIGAKPLIEHAIRALFTTSYQLARRQSRLRILCLPTGRSISLLFMFQGDPLPEEITSEFFELFPSHQANVAGGNIGLGPALAYQIVRLFDGEATVTNLESGEVSITLKLLRADDE